MKIEGGPQSALLNLVKSSRPGSFIDGRLSVEPENAIVYRTRQPLIDELQEVPMLNAFGVFPVSSIRSGRTQVGVCVRFNDETLTRIVQGRYASVVLKRYKNNFGKASVELRTSDFLIYSYDSRGALLIQKITKGRGYGG